MAILNNNPLIGSGGNQGYNINNSLRFRSSASAYLNRTPASAGNRKTFTWSGWFKKSRISAYSPLFYADAGGNTNIQIQFLDDNTLRLFQQFSGVDNFYLVTTQVFRDPSAWYHVVVAVDTTQATSSNRAKMYVNGVQVTAFSSTLYPTLNLDTTINSTVSHYVGYAPAGPYYFDGYLADVNFIDGSAKVASDFGETDTTTGVWKPKAYSGTYGTNGFYLKFSDIATTSGSNAGLGKDFSGNSNYWTTNNISVTSGSTYDAMTDVPTNTSATVANYCTLNPLVQRWAINAGVFSEANLKITTTGSSSSFGFGTIFNSTGKWYWEGTLTAAGTATPGTGVGDLQCQSGTFTNLIEYNKDGTHTGAGASWATYTTNDIIGVALDCDGGNIYFYKNNTLQGSVALTSGVSYAPLMDVVLNATWAANFGQRPFSYTPPTGYKALNTYNLPTPTILQGNKYMDAQLWTGDGVNNRVISQYSFYPDFTWIKTRSSAYWHVLADSVRGANQALFSNLTSAESTNDTNGYTSAFSSTGFTLTSGATSINDVNQNGQTYVGWCWNAGANSTSSNTSGTITSTVSVNTTAGFSVVTFTATGSNATVGHGLGVAPKMIITKQRNVTGSWATYHESLGNTKLIYLDSTGAALGPSSAYWNNTSPTSTVFTFGGALASNTNTIVAYCFAEIAGFSRFGSYTGNGSTDGPFVYTGFRPKFIMYKRTDATQSWIPMDTSRSPYNVADKFLLANASDSEYTGTILDMLSNGFKIREAGTQTNASGGTYIFMAFAENPFKNSLAR